MLFQTKMPSKILWKIGNHIREILGMGPIGWEYYLMHPSIRMEHNSLAIRKSILPTLLLSGLTLIGLLLGWKAAAMM